MVAIGIAASLWLAQRAPVGTDISTRIDLSEFLNDTTSPSLGPADASVVVVEFSDYQCPACRTAHPRLHAAARADGDVRIIYRDLPVFGEISERAARVALASDRQGIYPAVHDALMTEPGQLNEGRLRHIVERAGGDWNRILEDSNDEATEFQLAQTRNAAMRLGIQGTPTYLVGSYKIVGAITESQFRDAFDRARDQAPRDR